MKRVRYTKTEGGGLTATVTTGAGKELTVLVSQGTGGVINYTVSSGGEVLTKGLDLTLAGVKRQVRAQLVVLGVSLGQETRKRSGQESQVVSNGLGSSSNGVGITGDLEGNGTSTVKSSLFS